MEATMLAPGYVLPNGATIVAASMRNTHEWVILAVLEPELSTDSYVTWKARRPGDGSDTHAGHYFEDLREAVADFYERP